MRLSRRRRRTISEMNMTPMIDIVFLLIIFFMTVTQVSEINRERVQLPEMAGAEDQKPVELTLNINQDGDLIVSGRTLTMDEFLSLVAGELERLGSDPTRLTLVVRADERSASGPVNDVVRNLARMQITRIRIAVQVPE